MQDIEIGDITYIILHTYYIYIYNAPGRGISSLYKHGSFIFVLFALALNISYSYFIFYNLKRKSYF